VGGGGATVGVGDDGTVGSAAVPAVGAETGGAEVAVAEVAVGAGADGSEDKADAEVTEAWGTEVVGAGLRPSVADGSDVGEGGAASVPDPDVVAPPDGSGPVPGDADLADDVADGAPVVPVTGEPVGGVAPPDMGAVPLPSDPDF
jgi:hypothetical protein